MNTRYAVAALCFLTAACAIAIYPFFADALTQIRQRTELSGYIAEESSAAALTRRERRTAAEAYNAAIAKEQGRTPFAYRGEDATDPAYEAALGESPDGVLCALSIPKISLMLPVVHGTKAEDLEYRCGHMYGSSLPVGGRSTHAVLAGHTGLPSAALFTDLTKLEKGDDFYIRVLGEIHRYRVDAVRVVLPEEEAAYLQVADGEDLVTLYTCTPYGINSHRLLVRGKRVLPDPRTKDGGAGDVFDRELQVLPALRAAALFAVSPALFTAGLAGIIRKRRRAC